MFHQTKPQRSSEKLLCPAPILARNPASNSNGPYPSSAKLSHSHSASSSTVKILNPNTGSASEVSLVHSANRRNGRIARLWDRLQRWNDRTRASSITIFFILLIVIGGPLAVILPDKLTPKLPIKILVPFYLFPDPGAWDRLYDAVLKHSDLQFIVVVNPSNGPGPGAWPPSQYIDAIKKLNVYPNVRTVGYIDTKFGSRATDSVLSEIATYAGWSNSLLAMHGVFFDNTPFSDVDIEREYLNNISTAMRLADGFVAAKLVIHNTGITLDAGVAAGEADIRVVFEGPYDLMPRKETMSKRLEGQKGSRKECAYLVHSIPQDMGKPGIRKIVDEVRQNAEWLYVSDRMGPEKWEGYPNIWEEFLDLVW